MVGISNMLFNSGGGYGSERYRPLHWGERWSKKRQIERYVTVRSRIPLRNSSVNATKAAGDCTFTEEAINGKLCLLCSVTFTTYLVARSNQRISMYSIY